MMAEGLEYSIVVSHGEKIVAAISTDPKGLALSLHAKGLISDTDFEETNELNETKTTKARRLYSAVKKMIQHHPGRYDDFIRTFKDSGKLHCDLLKALNNSEGESSTSSGSIASYPSGAEVTLFTHDPVPCSEDPVPCSEDPVPCSEDTVPCSEDTVPVACSTDDVQDLAVHVGFTGSEIPRSLSDLSLDSGAPLDDSSISSLRVDCRCPCGRTDFTHLLDPPPDCLANRHSDALSFPEIHLKASEDKKKAQKQLKFELVEQTRCIKEAFITLGMAVYNYALSIPRADKIMRKAILLNEQVVETSDTDKLYEQFTEGANFINYDILVRRLNILKASDSGEENELRHCAEAAAERYEASFKEYAQQRVVLVPTALQGANGRTNSVYKELKIKVEEEFRSFEVNRLLYFKKVVKTILKLPPPVNLRITSVREGCVEICFEVIGLLADETFHLTTEQKQEMLANNITLLEYDGQTPYCCCNLLSDESSRDTIKKLYDDVCQMDYQNDELNDVEYDSQEHTPDCQYHSQVSVANVCPMEECLYCGKIFTHCSLEYHSLKCERSDSSCSSSSDESENDELSCSEQNSISHNAEQLAVSTSQMDRRSQDLFMSTVVQEQGERCKCVPHGVVPLQWKNIYTLVFGDVEDGSEEHTQDCPFLSQTSHTNVCHLEESPSSSGIRLLHCSSEYHSPQCESRYSSCSSFSDLSDDEFEDSMQISTSSWGCWLNNAPSSRKESCYNPDSIMHYCGQRVPPPDAAAAPPTTAQYTKPKVKVISWSRWEEIASNTGKNYPTRVLNWHDMVKADVLVIIGRRRMKSGDGGHCKRALFRGKLNLLHESEKSEYDPASIMHYWFDKNLLLPEYRKRSDMVNVRDEQERKVLLGVHDRDCYHNGNLAENPSKLHYKTLNWAYEIPSGQRVPPPDAAAAPPTTAMYTKTKVQTEATAAQLNQQCFNDTLFQLGTIIADHNSFKVRLGLSEAKINVIDQSPVTGPVRLYAALKMWQSRGIIVSTATCTYSRLMEIARNKDGFAFQSKIQKLLRKIDRLKADGFTHTTPPTDERIQEVLLQLYHLNGLLLSFQKIIKGPVSSIQAAESS